MGSDGNLRIPYVVDLGGDGKMPEARAAGPLSAGGVPSDASAHGQFERRDI